MSATHASSNRRSGRKIIAQNRKARHDYAILETFEAGVVLTGTEVKSLRLGRASLVDGFATIDDGEVYLRNVHIPEYVQGSWTNHEPRRIRKLLLHKGEILRLIGKTKESGLTLVPLSLYFADGKVKVELALARGKRSYDKRQDLARRDADREVRRALGRRAKGIDDVTTDVPAWWGALGLPGLSTPRALPAERVMAAVWRYFDAGRGALRPALAGDYRTSDVERARDAARAGRANFHGPGVPAQARYGGIVERLGAGVRRAHTGLRAERHVLSRSRPPPATSERRSRRVPRVFKVHVQVGDYDPRDAQLDEVWGLLADAAAPGGGALRQRTDPRPRTPGRDRSTTVLARHPRLTAVIAHCGMPEYAEHISLAERYPNVHLDTTMVGTPFMRPSCRSTARPAAAAGRAGGPGRAGHRLPEHPVSVRGAAGRVGAIRPRRRLAAGGLLAQRAPAHRLRPIC